MNNLAVVTGGTKGIGKAIVKAFASKGFNLAICARNEADLAATKKEIEVAYSNDCHTYQADLSKKEEVFGFVSFLKKLNEPVEVLVNNTGVFIPGQVHQEEEGVLEQMIETNLYSAYNLTRGLVGEMIKAKRGHIFNICSTASVTAYVNGGSYCISKFAMYGMTKVLREELKDKGVSVTAILPGATYTSSWEGADVPEERFMKADDVAKSILSAYKLSDTSVVEEITIRPQLGDL